MSASWCLPRRAGASVALVALAAAGLSMTSKPSSSGARLEQVIVTGSSGALSGVEQAVRGVGGQIRRALPIVNGVAARVPAASVDELRRVPGVRAVTPD